MTASHSSNPLHPHSTNDVASGSESTLSSPPLSPHTVAQHEPPSSRPRGWVEEFVSHISLVQDHRARIPPQISRFIGYRPISSTSLHDPLPFPPFKWLRKIPLRYEIWLFATIGAFTSILLIEAIMSTSTAFRDIYHTPLIVGSFGASAVLVFAVTEAPLAQPRNAVLGQVLSAIIGTAITRLWLIWNPDYASHLDNRHFYAPSFVNGALCMAVSLLFQLILGVLHPPGGATALAAATDPAIVALSWRYIPVVLASSLIMLGWALLINNVGRKRYPVYWWAPGQTFVKEAEKELKDLEAGIQEKDLYRGDDGEVLGEDLALARTTASWRWFDCSFMALLIWDSDTMLAFC